MQHAHARARALIDQYSNAVSHTADCVLWDTANHLSEERTVRGGLEYGTILVLYYNSTFVLYVL
jgi:hypothetical protein